MSHPFDNLTLANYLNNSLDAEEVGSYYLEKALSDSHNIYLSLAEHGGVLAVKDNFLTTQLPTTASATTLDGFFSPIESTVTQRLLDSKYTLLGKTNMDAWAHGSSTETSQFGTTKNPRNPKHLPGGSSGGSAAAVAGDLCLGAIGSETAGSIRQPASWCGVVGMKPTYGRVSRAGVVAMGSSLDCPGPITKTVEDSAILLNSIAGKDPLDATTTDQPVPDFTSNIGTSIKGLKIGVCYLDHPDLATSPTISAIHEAVEVLKSLGAIVELVPISNKLVDANSILDPAYAVSVYTVIQRSEVASNLNRYDGIRYGKDRSTFGDEAKRRVLLGTFTLSKGYADQYYLKAEKIRALYRQNFESLFSRFDLLISPTSPGYALTLGATAGNPMFGELEDMLLEPSSICGLPGISVPMMHDPKTNLFLGLNIVANHWKEEQLFQVAHAYEQATSWNEWAKKNQEKQ